MGGGYLSIVAMMTLLQESDVLMTHTKGAPRALRPCGERVCRTLDRFDIIRNRLG